MEIEESRSNQVVELGTPLKAHLQRLSDMRAKMTPEERRELPQVVTPFPVKPKEPPATAAEIISHLAALDLIYPANLTTEERSARYRIYVADLAHLPEWRIRQACTAYRRDPESRFYPTPGQLLKLAR
jgi:hypothetical protein